MAGSRLPKVGDIFTRTTGLLRAGAMKLEDKPLWYDVYEAFPPLQAPTYERAKPSTLDIKKIFYPEDLIRAKFYRKYGSPGTISLDETRRHKRPTMCETFVAAYQDIESRQEGLSDDQLMQEAEAELERRGIYLDRTRRPRSVEAMDEPLEEALETRSAITGAVLPDDVISKINFKDLFDSSKTSGGETSEASATTSESSEFGDIGTDGGTKIKIASASSFSDLPNEQNKNISKEDQNKDGSGSGT